MGAPRLLLAVVWLVMLASGCAYVPRAGDRLIVRHEAVVRAEPVIGGSEFSVIPDPDETFRDKPGLVLPVGASVQVLGEYDEEGRPTFSAAPAGAGTRWVMISVLSSPVPAQVGKQGWVHVRTVQKGGAPRANIEGMTTQTREEAPLCESRSGEFCSHQIPAGTPLRPLRCEGGVAEVEYWDAEGLYRRGFVSPLQLTNHQCESLAGAQRFFSAATSRHKSEPVIDASFLHTRGELEAFIQKETEGYTKQSGERVSNLLHSFEKVPISVRRGRCYLVVVRLQPFAEFSDHAKQGIRFLFHHSWGYDAIHGGPGIHGPGGVGSIGCPQEDGQVFFDLYANYGSADDQSRVHDLGRGSFTVEIYTKPISEAELKKQHEEMLRQFREADQRRQQDSIRTCHSCSEKRLECMHGGRSSFESCRSMYQVCVGSTSCP